VRKLFVSKSCKLAVTIVTIPGVEKPKVDGGIISKPSKVLIRNVPQLSPMASRITNLDMPMDRLLNVLSLI
jgi:hypothetical protein